VMRRDETTGMKMQERKPCKEETCRRRRHDGEMQGEPCQEMRGIDAIRVKDNQKEDQKTRRRAHALEPGGQSRKVEAGRRTARSSEAVDICRDAAPFGGAQHQGLVDLSETGSLGFELGNLLDHLCGGQLEVTDVGGGAIQ